jgi:hypothetical protein
MRIINITNTNININKNSKWSNKYISDANRNNDNGKTIQE